MEQNAEIVSLEQLVLCNGLVCKLLKNNYSLKIINKMYPYLFTDPPKNFDTPPLPPVFGDSSCLHCLG